MLGESALSLVKEAARNKGNLNPFNEDLVRQTIEETRRLWEQNRYCSGEYMIVSQSMLPGLRSLRRAP